MSDDSHISRFEIRKLDSGDFWRGYLDVLRQLSDTVVYDKHLFLQFYYDLGSNHIVYVVVDKETGRIIGACTLLIESKVIHNFSKVAHIEDFVIDSEYRGMHIGSFVLKFVVERARDNGCYKVILDCLPDIQEFYKKNGFVHKNNQMCKYF